MHQSTLYPTLPKLFPALQLLLHCVREVSQQTLEIISLENQAFYSSYLRTLGNMSHYQGMYLTNKATQGTQGRTYRNHIRLSWRAFEQRTLAKVFLVGKLDQFSLTVRSGRIVGSANNFPFVNNIETRTVLHHRNKPSQL